MTTCISWTERVSIPARHPFGVPETGFRDFCLSRIAVVDSGPQLATNIPTLAHLRLSERCGASGVRSWATRSDELAIVADLSVSAGLWGSSGRRVYSVGPPSRMIYWLLSTTQIRAVGLPHTLRLGTAIRTMHEAKSKHRTPTETEARTSVG